MEVFDLEKKNLKIKHHYIPQFYLSNFIDKNDPKQQLWVTDICDCIQRRAAPSAIAYINKLYMLEGKEYEKEPDAIETAFSIVEAKASEVIRKIERTEKLPTGDDYNTLINFLALMAARTPKQIEVMNKPAEDLMRIVLDMSVSTPQRWESVVSQAAAYTAINPSKSDAYDYEKMKDFIRSDRYKINTSQNFKIKTLFDAIDVLIPILAKRKWSLLISKHPLTTYKHVGGFICSDNPLALISTVKLHPIYSPGFGSLYSEVTLPLTKDIALIGKFEGDEEVVEITVSGMAAMNSRTSMYSDRFCYHANKNYLLINQNNDVTNVNDLLEYYRKHPKFPD